MTELSVYDRISMLADEIEARLDEIRSIAEQHARITEWDGDDE